MRKEVKFENDSELKDFQEYDENKLAIAKICVLSTAPNSHQLNISEEVLRRDIGTIRGNFLVADMMYGDATTHTPNEVPVGYFLPNEDIEFEEVEKDGMKIVKAWAYAVLSKRYATTAYEMFVQDNHRATSIEMTVETPEDDEHKVLSFNAFGSTILGKTVAPSCKDAEMSLVRFAEEANNFFDKKRDSNNSLKKFVEERKKKMAENKSYKIDKSKDVMSEDSWSEINKTDLRNKITKASNAKTLVKSVYLKIDADWEEAPSERLHYPVMQFKGDTLVYNRNALSNALARAVQNNEDAVIDKIKKIYKSLGLEQDGKEEDAEMAENTTNFEIEGRKAWAEVIKKVQDHEGKGVYVDSVEKDHIIYTKDDVRYRVEADVKVGKDDKSVDADIKWGTVKKDADQKMAEDKKDEEKKMSDDCDCKDDDHEDEDKDDDEEEEDFAQKCAEMQKSIEERDNIIMDKDKKIKEMEEELSDLREFKKTCMEKDKACAVESVMNEVKDFMNDEQFKALRDEGMACEFAQIDAWSNKVKAISFESVKGNKKSKGANVMKFSAPVDNINNKSGSVWDRLKNL